MGPRAVPPPLPELEANMMGEGQGNLRAMMLEWNWFQIMENGMDTAHQGILHFGSVTYEDAIDRVKAQQAYPGPVEDLKYIVWQRAPRIEFRDTDFGVSYDGWRNTPEGLIYHRIMHWLWPWYCMFPVQKLGTSGQANICVPMDDTHTMVWNMSTGRIDPSADGQRSTRTSAVGTSGAAALGNALVPNTPDWFGRFRPAWWEETKTAGTYDFGIDREIQKTSHTTTGFSGLASVPLQDGMINWSQGTIVDRSKEHLGTSDRAIIRVRRRLLEAAKALREDGIEPPAVDTPELYRQRSGWVLLPRELEYWEATQYMREAFLGRDAAPGPYTPGPMELAEAPKQFA
jgi:phthalate 4,5-dioxygenase oxygenase subunit